MDSKGQSALEYLMTYGWALIVIAIVIAVLIWVTSGATGGVTCQSKTTGIIVKEAPITAGTGGVKMTLMNATGGAISSVSAIGSGNFSGIGTVDPTDVPKNANFTVIDIDAPTTGNVNGTVTVSYTTEGTLDANATVVCTGTVS